MGSVRKLLSKKNMPPRELHHSRLFVDLAENIHIHHREYRTVFGLSEYFEYVDLLIRSSEDVKTYLYNNPNYTEHEYPTTIMVGGGRDQQLRFLSNSPKPNQSKYFDQEMTIELQDEYVTDEIHIHYRDFRIALDRERFQVFANCVREAQDELNKFLSLNTHERKFHPDQVINEFNKSQNKDSKFSAGGVKNILIDDISSKWFEDINKEFKPNKKHIDKIIDDWKNKLYVPPIILCNSENKKKYLIVDGHHRFFAAKKLGFKNIDAVLLDLSFDETSNLRQAEVLLKEFDLETGYKYRMSSFIKDYFLYKANRYYASHYKRILFRNTALFRFLRKIKQALFGREAVFKSFNELFNKGRGN